MLFDGGNHFQTNILLFNILLYADDLTLLKKNIRRASKSSLNPKDMCQVYGKKICTKKTKTMAFSGKNPVRTKLVVIEDTLG